MKISSRLAQNRCAWVASVRDTVISIDVHQVHVKVNRQASVLTFTLICSTDSIAADRPLWPFEQTCIDVLATPTYGLFLIPFRVVSSCPTVFSRSRTPRTVPWQTAVLATQAPPPLLTWTKFPRPCNATSSEWNPSYISRQS